MLDDEKVIEIMSVNTYQEVISRRGIVVLKFYSPLNRPCAVRNIRIWWRHTARNKGGSHANQKRGFRLYRHYIFH